jgi:multiple sugar transport system permease protein
MSVKTKKHAADASAYAALCVLSLIFMLPFFYMLFMSVMTNKQSVGNPEIIFFPREWVWGNYKNVFDASFVRYFLNTFLIIAVNLVTVPLAASLCAFGFTRCKFAGRKKLFAVVLATLMLPAVIVQIPLYVTFVKLGWISTPLPFTVPAILGGGSMNIFLAGQFMRSIPSSLDEAATIDGAGRYRVYFDIYLPLCKPILIFVMIGVFNGTWNDFMGPLMYLRDAKSYTLALGVFYKYAGALTADTFPNVQMATGAIMIIPSALVFFIFQKQLIEGVNISGIKA